MADETNYPGTDFADLVTKAVELAPPTIVAARPGFNVADREMHQIDLRPALPETLNVYTLSALVNLLQSNSLAAGVAVTDCALHVIGPKHVELISRSTDEYGRRKVIAMADVPPVNEFPFDQFKDSETFILNALALLSETPDREYVIGLAQALVSGETVTTRDDGVSQSTIIQKGASLKQSVTVRNRCQLAPFHTFREVTQPTSEFVFRLKQDNDKKPCLALFQSDGGAWKLAAMTNIANYLQSALTAASVTGVSIIC